MKEYKAKTGQKNENLGYMHLNKQISLKEAAAVMGVTTQCVRLAIINGRMKGKKISNHWYVTRNDIIKYQESKYQKDHHFSENEVSVKHAAKIKGCDIQQLYYLMRSGRLPFTKKSKAIYGIKKEDLKAVQV